MRQRQLRGFHLVDHSPNIHMHAALVLGLLHELPQEKLHLGRPGRQRGIGKSHGAGKFPLANQPLYRCIVEPLLPADILRR